MAKKSGNYRIPFLKDKTGWHMMEYAGVTDPVVKTGVGFEWGKPDAWRDNLEFDATLQLTGWSKGRSAVRINASFGMEHYSLALGGFYEAMIAWGVSKSGVITGRWNFRKQGANYGLYPVI